MHHNPLMRPDVHDVIALCRYQQSRLAQTAILSQKLRDILSERMTVLLLQQSRSRRILKRMIEQREKLAQQQRILKYGRTAKYLV